jgi:putative nucleotidyltransferase with HDIG domain
VKTENLVRHCQATEAIMRTLAGRLGHDENLWGVAGLLHDLDFESTKDTPERHGLVTAELLADQDVPQELVEAVKEHNAEALGLTRSEFGKALSAAETITGLIVATALVYPDKKVAGVKPKSIRKRMKEKAFARNVDRSMILLCEEVGVPLAEFIDLSLAAMKDIAGDIGL